MNNTFFIDNELKSHFLNLFAIALSDTQIDTIELEMHFKMAEERGISKEEIQKIILFPDQVKFSIPTDVITKIEYLYDFARIAWANRQIDEYEVFVLKKFCIKFGFDPANVPQITEFLIEEAKKGTDKHSLLELVKQNL